MDFTWRKQLNYFHSWFLKVNERPCFRIYIELYISLQEMLSIFFCILQLLTPSRSSWYLQSSKESPDAAKSPRAVWSVSFLTRKEMGSAWPSVSMWDDPRLIAGEESSEKGSKSLCARGPQNECEVLCKPRCEGTAGCRAGTRCSSKWELLPRVFMGLRPPGTH